MEDFPNLGSQSRLRLHSAAAATNKKGTKPSKCPSKKWQTRKFRICGDLGHSKSGQNWLELEARRPNDDKIQQRSMGWAKHQRGLELHHRVQGGNIHGDCEFHPSKSKPDDESYDTVEE
mmetsp:Transcript_77363/g.136491  ORF Transcript_77363/g.136491 Transcript_77363/m.136491 type:complete len:119 (-) Transcript_77363:244-600(-)